MNVSVLSSDLETHLVYLLWCAEYDGSGCVLLRVYQNWKEAQAAEAMLRLAGAPREIRVDAVQFVTAGKDSPA